MAAAAVFCLCLGVLKRNFRAFAVVDGARFETDFDNDFVFNLPSTINTRLPFLSYSKTS